MVTLLLPTINDDPTDFDKIFSIWNLYKGETKVVIDFSNCTFIRQNGVVMLGGLITHINKNGGEVFLKMDTLLPAVEANLSQNGFFEAMGFHVSPWLGNSIPFRRDLISDPSNIIHYLEEKWLGRGWVQISPELSYEIVGNVWEIFTNAFEHSYSDLGVFSCGQFFPQKKELTLAVFDFGIGIPHSVRDYFFQKGDNREISDEQALEISFQSGFSTKPKKSRGVGLSILKDFVMVNQGKLNIYSHNGRAQISSEGAFFTHRKTNFSGTAVNITLKCDNKYYYLRKEHADSPFF